MFYAGWFLAGSARGDSPVLAWCLFAGSSALALYLLLRALLGASFPRRLPLVGRRLEDWHALVLERRIHRKAAAVAGLLLASLHIRYCVVQRVQVRGPSMVPTLAAGQTLWTEKLSNGFDLPPLDFPFQASWQRLFPTGKWPRFGLGQLERGDIVVFFYPGISGKNEWFIKRVIGLPGDRYELRDGRVQINGSPLPETYLPPGIPTRARPLLPQPPIPRPPAQLELLDPRVKYSAMNGAPEKGLVPAHTVYVLGDNRAYSRDSRSFGFVPMFFIRGVALGWSQNRRPWLNGSTVNPPG